MKPTITLSLIGLFLISSAMAQSTQPAIPASGADDNAVNALKNSTRHGEWDDIPEPGSDVKIHTWVVYPERKDKAPVVLIIHEIFGMSDWVRGVADQMAAEGFIAVAPDFLSGKGPNGGGTESFGNNATSGVSALKSDEEMKVLDAVRDYALKFPSATDKSACVGFCWGGGVSFNYAAHQPALNAAAVYYGVPPSKDNAANIKCPVMGFYGENDNRITATVDPTIALMKELSKEYTPHIYAGAGHGFLRQQTGANLTAAQQAWPITVGFFKKNLEAH